MPYPIVTDAAARVWWKAWKESGKTDEPPARPEVDTSVEGGDHDWPGVVARLMDHLGALYDAVEKPQTAARAGVVGRIFGGRSGAEAMPMTNDRFEAAACVAVHEALPRDAALADPEFWIWMATGPGLDLIRRRYPGKGEAQIPDRLNFTSASARETFFYRLWVRAELAHDPALADPYELARYGDIDFWRSHVFRQMSTETGPLLAAFIRFQHPEGPDGKKRLTQDEIRALVKYMRRAAANMLVETLDEQEAARFVEEQWQKIRSTRSRQTAAE
ncbi:MAG: DUF6339 family protein [Opitutales bacterium]